MNLDVPDPRSVQLGDLPGGSGVVQRFVDAHRGPQLPTEPRMTDQLVGGKRLLDIQEIVVVQIAQRRFVLGPLVGSVGIHRERQARPGHRVPSRFDRHAVPAWSNLDLDSTVAAGQRIIDPSAQGLR
jgi:hypothetical protein